VARVKVASSPCQVFPRWLLSIDLTVRKSRKSKQLLRAANVGVGPARQCNACEKLGAPSFEFGLKSRIKFYRLAVFVFVGSGVKYRTVTSSPMCATRAARTVVRLTLGLSVNIRTVTSCPM
jgi:hypothetical protein